MGISRYLLAGTILLTIPFFASRASADEVIERRGELIGRWCDTSIASMPEYDYIIEIWKLEAGKYSYHQLFKSKDPDQPSICLLYTSPSPRDRQKSRMPSSA